MIDQKEFAICETRGHDLQHGTLDKTYRTKCRWCGAWVREVKTTKLEIQEEEPPVAEQSPFLRLAEKNARTR